VSQSTSSTLWPSAIEQQGPLRLARLSNHCLSGEFAYLPSRSRVRANPIKNGNDNGAQQTMPRTSRNFRSAIRIVLFLMHGTPVELDYGLRLTKSNWTDVCFSSANVRFG